ncbi:FAD-dependent thymidylate synthase [bacterium]|nr:FAD-dependent thymidylate synthase [bacterium]
MGRREQRGLLADAVREVLGRARAELSDAEAVQLALSPARNPLLSENMNLSTHSKLLRAMVHPSYTFRKKLSHTADSQDQRHRMTPASRPVLGLHYTGEPDYITPRLIQNDEAVRREYDEEMARTWEDIEGLVGRGAAMEYALYLLPNAVAIRFTESSDLLNLHHKHAMRLCYNAQEEIWRASWEEARQVRALEPEIGASLLPPCAHRAQARRRPICPEGQRYCGVLVWKLDLGEYRRVI